MSMTNARAKLLHRIGSPVEILYDVSLHWSLMLLVLLTGTVVMLTKVLNEPPIYEATATLVLNQNEVVPPESEPATPSRRATARRETDLAFTGQQMRLIQSDTVLDKVVAKVGDKEVLEQNQDPDPLKQPGLIQRVYRSVSGEVSSMLEDADAVMQAPANDAERQRQKAKLALRRRSSVTTETRSNLITLGIRGTRRAGLKAELEAWIEAYRERIDEATEETDRNFYQERIDACAAEEREAKTRLDEFRKENPDINQVRQDLQRETVATLRRAVDELTAGERGVPLPPLPRGRSPFVERDARVEFLRRERDRLESALIEMRAKVPPTNLKLKTLEAAIKDLERKILGLAGPPVKEEPGRTREQQMADLQKEVNVALVEQARIDDRMDQLTALTTKHQSALLMLSRYKDLREAMLAQNEVRKLVDIKVQDSPMVSVDPVAKPYYQVALGLLGGGMMGFVLSFGVEMFCQRVRLRKDLEEELGLKVIGVIPGE